MSDSKIPKVDSSTAAKAGRKAKSKANKAVRNPNQKSHGFLWALIALLVIAAVVIGYIVMNGQNAKTDKVADRPQTDVHFNVTYKDQAIELRSPKATDKTPVVDLYEDFACPHCGEMARATDGDMAKAIEDGKLVVNIRTLVFLDQDNKDGHSHHAGSAAQAVAKSGNAKTFWNYRAMMLEDQEKIYNKWSDADFAQAAKHLGADDDTAKTIKDGANQEDFNKDTQANYERLEKAVGQVSTPLVIQNGKEVQLENWIENVTKGQK